jgi:hypothetical protein
MDVILIVLVILLLCGSGLSAPSFGWHHYGWGPSGGLGLLLIIVLVVLLLRR